MALGILVAASGAVAAQDASPAASGLPPSWSPAPPAATLELVRDTFDAPGDWWVGSDDVGTSSIADGGMRWTIVQDGRSIWDTPELPSVQDVVRVEAAVLVEDGIGAAGPVCAGSDTGERAIWAGVNGDDEWLVGRIADSRVQVIERGDLARVLPEDAWIGAPVPLLVTLECAVGVATTDSIAVWVEGVRVAEVVDERVGPYLRAGLMATADEAGLAVLFDDFAVFGGPQASPSPSVAPGA
jgi:hypothetical protein